MRLSTVWTCVLESLELSSTRVQPTQASDTPMQPLWPLFQPVQQPQSPHPSSTHPSEEAIDGVCPLWPREVRFLWPLMLGLRALGGRLLPDRAAMAPQRLSFSVEINNEHINFTR